VSGNPLAFRQLEQAIPSIVPPASPHTAPAAVISTAAPARSPHARLHENADADTRRHSLVLARRPAPVIKIDRRG